MSEKIEDVKSPVVGKFYLVPCIRADVLPSGRPLYRGRWLPVIGTWHEDTAIVQFEAWHFHYDWRFMPKDMFMPPTLRYTAEERSHGRVATRSRTLQIEQQSQPFAVEHRRRKMLRPMPDFPAPRDSFVEHLEQAYKDHVLKCRTCPHRGMSLDGLPIDEQGRVVCNGHGLRWNLNTGALAPRLITQ